MYFVHISTIDGTKYVNLAYKCLVISKYYRISVLQNSSPTKFAFFGVIFK